MSEEPKGHTVTYPDWMARQGGTIPWTEVDARLREARNYWVASIRRDGLPHTRPVWGVWLDHRVVLSAGGGYWMLRNLRGHPLTSVHPEDAEGLVVVVEGRAVPIDGDDHVRRVVEEYNRKYEWNINDDEFKGGLEVAPDRIFAWRTGDRDFHDYDATRFDFGQDDSI